MRFLLLAAAVAGAVKRSKLHLLFLDGPFQAPDVWQRWYEDSRVRFNYTLRQPLNNAERSRLSSETESSNLYLKGSVYQFEGQSKLEVPRWLSTSVYDIELGSEWSLFGQSRPSKWHELNFALSKALKLDNVSTHFVALPADSIPLKTFDIFWANLQVDRRSRFTLEAEELSPYVVLTRQHAMWATKNPAVWVNNPEQLLLSALDEKKVRLDNATTFGNRVFSPYDIQTNPLFIHKLDVYTKFIGQPSSSSSLSLVQYGLVKYLSERQDVWVMKDLTADTQVVGCDMTEIDYYTYWVRIGAGDGDLIGELPEDRLKRLQETDERRNIKCPLLQATRQVLLLKAGDPMEDFWDYGTGTLARGDPGWYNGWVD